MGKKAEAGTPKAIANAMKAKGLQKLRWYCQVCQKQCRDENAFKQHSLSEGHVRQMLVVGENAGSYINEYSNNFKNDFIALLSRRWGTKRVRANQVYQEFIQDKHHSHMNATKWVTLTGFVQYLGKSGICHVDETEKGWFIAWIDNSPKALAKQDAALKKERSDMDDEQRQRKLMKEQMERAKAAEEERLANQAANGEEVVASTSKLSEDAEVDITALQPIKLSFGGLTKGKERESQTPEASPAADTTTSQETPAEQEGDSTEVNKPSVAAPSIAPIKPKVNPLKMSGKPNPLKANPLKAMSSKSSTTTDSSSAAPHKRPLSAVEAIVQEEMEKKRRREQATWSGSKGHGRQGLQQRG